MARFINGKIIMTFHKMSFDDNGMPGWVVQDSSDVVRSIAIREGFTRPTDAEVLAQLDPDTYKRGL